MTPNEYEAYVGSLFAKEGYDVVVSPYSNDWGIDVIATKGDEKIGIQAKMYGGSSRSVNRRVVMELYGASAYQDCTRAVLVTDGRVMPDAIHVAEKLGIEIIRTSDIEEAAQHVSTDSRNPHDEHVHMMSFDEAWEKFIIPLTGKTLNNSRGTNFISRVDWSGVKRITSNGKPGRIDIEGFRLAYNILMKQGSVTRDCINQLVDSCCSSGIVLILSQIPFIEPTSSPAGLKVK